MGNNAFVKWQNFKYEDSFTVPFIAVCDFLSLFKVFRFYDLHTDCEGREGNFAMKFRKNSKDEGRIVHKTSLNFWDEQKLWFLKQSDCMGMRPLGLMGTHAWCARTSPDISLLSTSSGIELPLTSYNPMAIFLPHHISSRQFSCELSWQHTPSVSCLSLFSWHSWSVTGEWTYTRCTLDTERTRRLKGDSKSGREGSPEPRSLWDQSPLTCAGVCTSSASAPMHDVIGNETQAKLRRISYGDLLKGNLSNPCYWLKLWQLQDGSIFSRANSTWL